MRAVNLIPADQRKGAGGASGRSEGAAYVLIGFLAALVMLGVVYAISHKRITDRQGQAQQLAAQAARAQERANQLTAYSSFLTLRDSRVSTVASLAASRFDWAHAIHEIGRVLPYHVALTQVTGALSGTTQPGVSGTSSSAGGGPSMTLTGCAISQAVVAQTLVRLRLIDGVADVSLQSSDRTASASVSGGGGTTGGAVTDCRQGHPSYPLFKILVSFAPLPAAGPAAAGATSPAVATPTPASAATPTPSAPSTTASAPGAAAPAASTAASAASTPTVAPTATTSAYASPTTAPTSGAKTGNGAGR